jgi:hypothetical protein
LSHHVKITDPQIQTVQYFLKVLYDGTLKEYWDILSEADRVALHTAYLFIRISNKADEFETFQDYIIQSREEQRAEYEKVKTGAGISHQVKYNEREMHVFLFEDTRVKTYYIRPTQAKAYKVVLVLDVENDMESAGTAYNHSWKIRTIDDAYRKVTSETSVQNI